MIYDIIVKLNEQNGSNYKISTLKKFSTNKLLERVLKMTYDTVKYNYGIGKTSLQKIKLHEPSKYISLEQALDILETKFCARELTGNDALREIENVLSALKTNDRYVLTKVIERDLRINLGKTQINKVFKDLITKPIYMRCDVYSKKTANNISFPAILQKKADGTYREFTVTDGNVSCCSRSGETYEYPSLFNVLKNFDNGVYTGELTVNGISDRAKGNGLINSDEVPHDDLILDLWDYITLDEYALAGKKDKMNPCKTKYSSRFEKLKSIIKQTQNVRIIESHVIQSLKQALEITSDYMSSGFEGGVLKDMNGVFKDGTSKYQLKLKLKIDCEMRISGFQAGTIGTKRDGKIGSILFENDEGTIKGKTSGFSDDELDKFSANQDKLIGKIITVQFNDLTKAENNEYWSLSHPRFIEIRDDKTSTDSLETVLKLRKMAMELS